MILPALLAIIVPIVVGLLLGVNGVAGLIAGATITGFVLAVMMANFGGAWDNAKKYIEAENLGGKGSLNSNFVLEVAIFLFMPIKTYQVHDR